jgi:hypothetical protein
MRLMNAVGQKQILRLGLSAQGPFKKRQLRGWAAALGFAPPVWRSWYAPIVIHGFAVAMAPPLITHIDIPLFSMVHGPPYLDTFKILARSREADTPSFLM